MGSTADTARSQRAAAPTLVGRIVAFPLRIAGTLLASLILSIAVECVGMAFFWPEQGSGHARQMLEDEMGHLSNGFRQSLLLQDPEAEALKLVRHGYGWLFVHSGLLERIERNAGLARAQSQPGQPDFRRVLGRAYIWSENYLLAAAYTTLTFLLRVLVLTLTLPLTVLAMFVGLIDGLVRRDVRRFGAGRESGFLYHRVKAFIFPLLVLPWVLYLAMPVSVHPLAILLPANVLLGMSVALTAATFKKYL